MSVIIPTLNRENSLFWTVKKLVLEQSYRKLEIIIVDQSDDNQAKKNASLAERYKGWVKYVHLRERGLPNARNVGIRNSKGEIVLFVDDDIIPSSDLIKYHVSNYYDLSIGGVAGRVIEKGASLNSTPGCKISKFGRRFGNIGFNYDRKMFCTEAKGCNMSFRREAIEKTGDFDVGYIGTAVLEETDFCFRLRKNGYKIIYEPEAYVFHLFEIEGGCRPCDEFERVYFSQRNDGRFFAKHFHIIYFPFFFTTLSLRAFKWGILRLKSFKSFMKLLISVIDGFKSLRENNDG